MKKVCWPYFDPDFDNLPERINGPSCRVCVDNDSLKDCTVIKVDSVNKQDLLMEVIKVLTDLNLSVAKGFISSDAGWFMDVFHVKDEQGKKLTDPRVVNYIEQNIGRRRRRISPMWSRPPITKDKSGKKAVESYECEPTSEQTAIEMTGTDRPGLFSEISAALADLHCNIIQAHAWSHNARMACVVFISDQSSHSPIDDPLRIASIEQRLTTVLKAAHNLIEIDVKQHEVKSEDVPGQEGLTITNVERRLHQLMLSVRDFDIPPCDPSTSPRSPLQLEQNYEGIMKATVSIESCFQKGYSIVCVECRDRPRVIFDAVCTLIDMQYVIFHASIRSRDGYAFQEYFIRHRDGRPLSTQSEKDRVVKCLEAAVERRACEGVKLEMWANNRVGLLSDITRVLRENDLSVVRADIATQGEKAMNAFYVRHVSGKHVEMEVVESVKKEMSPINLKVKNETTPRRPNSSDEKHHFSLSHILRSHIQRFSPSSV